jgi:hypothetical protein
LDLAASLPVVVMSFPGSVSERKRTASWRFESN